MTIEHMIEANERAKKDVDLILQSSDENRIEQLQKRLYDENRFAYAHHSELTFLTNLSDCAMGEKQYQQPTCLEGIHSYEEAVTFYRKVRFVLYRIEQGMPEEDLLEGYAYLKEKNVQISFLMFLIKRHIIAPEKVALKLSRIYKSQKDFVNTFRLLTAYSNQFPKNQELKLELADTYLMASKPKEALKILETLENPSLEVLKLIKSLRALVGEGN